LEQTDAKGLMQGLALTNIYMQRFEEAFNLYNQLIDEQQVKDTQTLLYAGIAAIGAEHKANAIALLDLSRLEDKRNFEARYGLGLLYQEVRNYEGAALQYTMMGDERYESEYFDFKLAPATEAAGLNALTL